MKVKAKTHLGNPMLHRRHSVMIEGGQIPRARVMNQTMIDQYLMRGSITLSQHVAGEYLLEQARRAGVWPTGVNLAGAGSRDGRHDYVPLRGHGLGNTLAGVEKEYGWFHRYLVLAVVAHNWDVSEDEVRMEVLREALDHIFQHRVGGGRRWRLGELKGAA